MMYAIAGVSGQTGSVVADTLLGQGHRVRAIVRAADRGAAWAARGAAVAVAALEDASALARALEGCDGAYLLIPPDFAPGSYLDSRQRVIDGIAAALERTRPSRVVFLSSIAAQLSEGTGPIVTVHRAERALGGIPGITLLRPGYFLENWAAVLPMTKEHGILPSFIAADQPTVTLSVRDIGRAAAELLVDAAAPRVVELAGKHDYTPADVATALSGVLERPVRVHEAPLDQVVPTFTAMGMPSSLAELYRELYEALAAGRICHEGTPRRGDTDIADALRAMAAR